MDRPYDKLIATGDRPLSKTPEALSRLYKKRLPIYKETADVIINADGEAFEVAEKIRLDFFEL